MEQDNPFASIPYGAINRDMRERVLYNTMIVDAAANVQVFADLNPLSMALVQENAYRYGALVADTEPSQHNAIREGNRIPLNYTSSRASVLTDQQLSVLEELASKELEASEVLNKRLVERAKKHLPAVWYAEVAFVPTGLYFRLGTGHFNQFRRATDYLTEATEGLLIQAHREWNAGVRSHLSDMGVNMREIPKPELSEERRQAELEKIDPVFAKMLARAQTLQLVELGPSQLAVAVAKFVVAKAKS